MYDDSTDNKFDSAISKELTEALAERIRADLRAYIGAPLPKNFKQDMVAYIGEMTKNAIETSPNVGQGTKVEAEILWKTMTLKEKAKWFFYNKIFKKSGNSLRKQIDDINFNNRLNEEPGEYWMPIPYPDYLNQTPKSTIAVNAEVKLCTPIEYIAVDLVLKK